MNKNNKVLIKKCKGWKFLRKKEQKNENDVLDRIIYR